MQTTFLNAAGTVLFVRDDMEQGNWTQEEYTVNATFTYNADKVIQRGQRISFRDPATNGMEFFEIRNVTNNEPEHSQQIIAEHIAVSELSDEHINKSELTNKTALEALTLALTGTSWAAGNSTVSGTSSADIARGSVWQAVTAISENWNCYIIPRVTVDSAGNITGKYLDITPAQGTWRGVLLSVSKNVSDSSVTYDDTEVYTALYGYGGSVSVTHSGSDDTQAELTFADVEWSATAGHPAKPLNQTYLEDPAKTALYGRNGRPRFGYYQNTEITNAETLLEKTWEALKQTSSPKICITGTVTDLYRLGYADQPLRLHDTAIVEVMETGERFEKEIIKLDVDLINPTATKVDVGDYIENIIYIERRTNEQANGGGGGGGGRAGGNKDKGEEYDTYWDLERRTDKNGSLIAMVVGTRNGDDYIKAGQIGLAINRSGESGSYESTAYIDATHVNISATNTAYSLAGDLVHDASGKLIIKSAGGMYVRRTDHGITSEFGVWDDGNLTGGVMVQQINGQTGTKLTLKADVIDIDGIIESLEAKDVMVANFNANNGEFTGDLSVLGNTGITAINIGSTYGDIDYLTTQEIIIDPNTFGAYSLTVDGTVVGTILSTAAISFNLAVTMSGGWSGNVYTATATRGGTVVDSVSTGGVTCTLNQNGGTMGFEVKDGSTTIASGGSSISGYHPNPHTNCIQGLTSVGYMYSGDIVPHDGYYWRKSSSQSLTTYYS